MKISTPKYFVRRDLKVCGIYFLLRKGRIVYIGKSIDVISRITAHSNMIDFDCIRVIECDEDRLKQYEKRWIIRFRPKHNTSYILSWRWRDTFSHGRYNTRYMKINTHVKSYNPKLKYRKQAA